MPDTAQTVNSYFTNRRQLYILPTRIGWIFSLLLFALLIAAIRFNHQATYLLTFVLASIAQVTSLYTHKNLLKLKISVQSSSNVFCNETAMFRTSLNNPTESERSSIWLICDQYKAVSSIPANNSVEIDVPIKARQRGKLMLPPIILSSQYPIGILFSWTKAFQANAHCIVYPQPKSFLPMPIKVEMDINGQQNSDNATNRGIDELSHTRPYQQGDRPRDIHWQTYAKHQQLVSRELVTDAVPRTVFDWQHVANLAIEDKLSQLTQWVLEAENKKINYQVSIPGFTSDLNHGPTQKIKCLTQLALWNANEANA